jgi:hypothetical protein
MNTLNIDGLIDRFVSHVNRTARQRIREEDLPVELREGGARFGLYYSWTIQPFSPITWIEPIESKLPAPLPPSYRSLVTRYLFPAFHLSPLMLLGNTGHSLYNEFSYAVFKNKALSDPLLRQGYAQFARPSEGDSDPICFDFNRRGPDGECPIVRLSHADVLQGKVAETLEELSPSFAVLVESVILEGLDAMPR